MDISASGTSNKSRKDTLETDENERKLLSDRLRWSHEDPMHNYIKLQKIKDKEERVKELQAMLESSSSSESSSERGVNSHRKHKKRKKSKDSKKRKRKEMWVEKDTLSNEDIKHSNSCKKRKKHKKEHKHHKSGENSHSHKSSYDSKDLVDYSDNGLNVTDKSLQYWRKKMKHKVKRKSKHKTHSKED